MRDPPDPDKSTRTRDSQPEQSKPPSDPDQPVRDVELVTTHWGNYSEYSKTLRAWLVAYGIGGPVLIFTNDKLFDTFSKAANTPTIVRWFLAGVALQVALALINKWGAYNMYLGANDEGYKESLQYRFWDVVTDMHWIDMLLDVLSIASFVIATFLAFVIAFPAFGC